jgi:hypothetical protein
MTTMFTLDIATQTSLSRPDADGGFVTWLDITVISHDLATDEDQEVGTARAAIVHVGAIANSEESLADVLDADSDELEALYGVYFEDDWLRADVAEAGGGSDLLYLSTLELDKCSSPEAVAVSIVRRLCETLASGCGLAVVPYPDNERIDHWLAAGFEITQPTRNGTTEYLHLDTGLAPPDPDLSARSEPQGAAPAPPSWTEGAQTSDERRQEFRNRHGERWIASATPDRFLLTGGDISWRTIRVEHPAYEQLAAKLELEAVPAPTFEGVILNREEQLWLVAVLRAAPGTWQGGS